MVEVETVNTSINIANTLDFGAKHTIHHQLVHVKTVKEIFIDIAWSVNFMNAQEFEIETNSYIEEWYINAPSVCKDRDLH